MRKTRVFSFIKNKKVLVIGATGSWGRELIRQLIKIYFPSEIRVFSRDEHKQLEMRQDYESIGKLKYLIGDIRNSEVVENAMMGVDIVVNCAALKHVNVSEENPWEVIQTNIIGVNNVIAAAFRQAPNVVVQISSDKAVEPVSLYGFSKGAAEKLMTAAHFSPAKPKNSKFVCVRAGNVLGTTASVVPRFYKSIKEKNQVNVTDPKMSRFFMRLEDAIDLLLKAMVDSTGGEIFVTKMPGVNIKDLTEVMIEFLGNTKTKIKYIGIRPGEKMYEILVSEHESPRTIEDGEYYVIIPHWYEKNLRNKYARKRPIKFKEYTSLNTHQLDKKGIYKLLKDDGWFDKE